MVTTSSNANLLNHLEESHFYSTKFATMRKQLAFECYTVSILPSNFNGLLLYSQCYIILARLKSETRGALSPASFPGLFQGTHHPKAESCLTPGKRQSSHACQVHYARYAGTGNPARPARGTHHHRPLPLRLQFLSREHRQGGPERRRDVSGALQTAPLLAQLGERRAQVGGRERPASRTRRRASGQGRRGGPAETRGRGAGLCVAPRARRCASPVFNVSVFARPGLARGGTAETRRSAAGQGRGARWGPGGRWREDCVPRRSPGSW